MKTFLVLVTAVVGMALSPTFSTYLGVATIVSTMTIPLATATESWIWIIGEHFCLCAKTHITSAELDCSL